MVRSWSDIGFVATFVGTITAIGALTLLRPADRESLARENRTPAPAPPLRGISDAKKLPERFDAYFSDRLAFREPFLNLHARIKVDGFGVSSSPKVLLGQRGWLFLDESSENSGVRIEPTAQVETWRASFAARRDWLKRRGIDYVVVVTPEKHTVYDELLPGPQRPPQPPTPAELLEAQLGPAQEHQLRQVLRSAKGQRRLYFQTDTHWNDDGAYVAYIEITRRLAARFPAMRALPRDRFEEVPVAGFIGDLGRMLHLPEPLSERIITLRLRDPKARRLDLPVPLDPRLQSPNYLAPQVWGTGDPRLPRGVIFHDSFTERLQLPLLAEHFELLVYAPTHSFDPRVVEQFRPNVVIQQLVERRLNRYPPLLPAGIGQFNEPRHNASRPK